MTRNMICIECPRGCHLVVECEGGKALSVTGNQCPRGDTYARQEVEHPMRTFTSSILTSGLDIKMLPVRTSGSIPKDRLFDAMAALKKLTADRPVLAGEVLVKDFLGLGVDLVACRRAVKA